MKLIERNNLLQALGVFYFNKHANKHFWKGIETAMNIVKFAPTVDVVRCDECIAFQIVGGESFCAEYGGYVTEEDCCSRGRIKNE